MDKRQCWLPGVSRQGLRQNTASSPLLQVGSQETSLPEFPRESQSLRSTLCGRQGSGLVGVLVGLTSSPFISVSPVPYALPRICFSAVLWRMPSWCDSCLQVRDDGPERCHVTNASWRIHYIFDLCLLDTMSSALSAAFCWLNMILGADAF